MSEQLQIRIHGPASLPTMIYFPGVHGDWTLAASLRAALKDKVRFVEFAYPRNTHWSLADYVSAIVTALSANGITEGWFLGESFGSQLVWAFTKASEEIQAPAFQLRGIILAGGFARHPAIWEARLALALGGVTPKSLLRSFLWAYVKYARFRHRRAPETLASIAEFADRRRAPKDYEAIRHRVRLIVQNDPRNSAHTSSAPVYLLTGLFDPVVPWPFVLHWFRRHCPSLRDSKIIFSADHTVLATAPHESAAHISRWLCLPGS